MKTVDEIITNIKDEVKGQPSLDGLDTTKKSSVFGSIIASFANVLHGTEKTFADVRDYIVDRIDTQKAGTAGWYILKLKQFQLGDKVNDFGLYDKVDDSKRIISGAAIESLNSELILKVRKKDGLLSSDERAKLSAYINDFKFAGTQTQLRNVEGDEIDFSLVVAFNISVTTEQKVKRKIKDALGKFFNNIDFDGYLIINKMIDAIQTVEGVVSIILKDNGVYVKSAVGNRELQKGTHRPYAGYYKYDDSKITITASAI